MAAGRRTEEPTRPRPATPRRGFRLLDAMILVAATAGGFTLMRWISHVSDQEHSWGAVSNSWAHVRENISAGGDDLDLILGAGFFTMMMAMPFAAAWTLALIPIRLAGPRPRLRRLTRQPGFLAACAWVLSAVFPGLIVCAGAAIAERTWEFSWLYKNLQYNWSDLWVTVPICPALAVVAAWATLLVSGVWRAEASWIGDRQQRIDASVEDEIGNELRGERGQQYSVTVVAGRVGDAGQGDRRTDDRETVG